MSDTKRIKYGKKVCEINESSIIINIWDSLAEAEEQTKLDRYKISDVCNGHRLTTGNKKFKFLDDKNQIIEPIFQTNKTITNRITKSSKAVIQMDSNGKPLNEYESIALAAKACKCDGSAISKVCNGLRKQCGGFKWKYKIN